MLSAPVWHYPDTMQRPDDAITFEQASIEIDAPPEAVYALVSDMTRIGEWSPEAIGAACSR